MPATTPPPQPQSALVSKLQFLDTLTKFGQAVLMESELAKPIVKPSPTEQKIFNVVGSGRVMGKTIAKALGRAQADGNPDSNLRETLGTLVRHSFLINHDKEGYSVHPFWAHLVQEDGDDSATTAPQ
jgi:hypothetical protein